MLSRDGDPTPLGSAIAHFGRLHESPHALSSIDGMEDQFGALGLVLNRITLWNTVDMDAALEQLRDPDEPLEALEAR